ncbi:MAG: LuxR family transcriptional regulator [Amycolatopsis sp.]|uniref:LuxR C-terminal-related transcriptional regulator n=1 Tax=Amycolatopsis sp. TaxID=37632 RepID=UPI002636208C|nr:response regulator transcription factor [Amycolatopsis sp.]MCU1681872.1 LuxR family transcriptional regulator [Amycolatopsis sp.]
MAVSVVLSYAHRDERLAGVDGVTVLAEVPAARDVAGEVRRCRPDVLVIDPRSDGLPAIREVVRSSPGTAVLVFSEYGHDEVLFGALRAGVRGYLLKPASPVDLVRAIRSVAAGSAVFGGDIARRITEVLVAPGARPGPFPQLTVRQQEILTMLATGLPVAAIAVRLHLTPKTVRNHSSSIFTKLGVSDRESATTLAREAGLVGR